MKLKRVRMVHAGDFVHRFHDYALFQSGLPGYVYRDVITGSPYYHIIYEYEYEYEPTKEAE